MEHEGVKERRKNKESGLRSQSLRSCPWTSIPALWHQGQYAQSLGCQSSAKTETPCTQSLTWLEGKKGNRRALIYNTSNTSATSKSPEQTANHVNRGMPDVGAPTRQTPTREPFLLFCHSHSRLEWGQNPWTQAKRTACFYHRLTQTDSQRLINCLVF